MRGRKSSVCLLLEAMASEAEALTAWAWKPARMSLSVCAPTSPRQLLSHADPANCAAQVAHQLETESEYILVYFMYVLTCLCIKAT